jgi:3-phenylpropionate/trans-cinnamate dioxygenase ferredoxin subunit
MAPVTITVRKDGPYRVEGDIVLVDHEGNPIPFTRKPDKPWISLCRCGASSTKPICDGTHSKIGFRGAEEAARAHDAGQIARE